MSKKSILDIIKDEEEKYIFKHYSLIKNGKQAQIDQIIKRIKIQHDFKGNEYHQLILKDLNKLSQSKGGFLSNANRIVIYQFILNTLQEKDYQESTDEWDILDKNTDIIMNDCKRSVLFSIISHGEWPIESTDPSVQLLINDLNNFISKALGPLISCDYYQGYQELALYFYLLFGKNKGIVMMRKFTNQFVYYYMNKSKENKIAFDDVLNILSDSVGYINKDIFEVMNTLTKTKPYYSLSWIITWFTHNNYDLFHQFRIIDYLICSNYNTIYALTSMLLVNECNAMNLKENMDKEDPDIYMGELLSHFQKLKIENIDIDGLIIQTEKTFVKSDWVNNLFKKNLTKGKNKELLKSLEIQSFQRDIIPSNKGIYYFIGFSIIIAIIIELYRHY